MTRLWARIRAFIRHRRHGSDADDALQHELESYLQMDIDARVQAGQPRGDATRKARAALGGLTQVTEAVRGARTGAWLDATAQDVRAAVRTIRRTPAFSCAIVTSLALGLAAVLAALAFVNGLLFRQPIGVSEPERLIRFEIDLRCAAYSCGGLRDEDVRALTNGPAAIRGLAAEATGSVAIGLPEAESLRAALVSDGFFEVLGVRLQQPGRAFSADAETPAAVISHRLWVRAFASDPAILGRTLRVADETVPIVGVAPEGFAGVRPPGAPRLADRAAPEIWLPLRFASRLAGAGHARIAVLARLEPGTDEAAMRSRLMVAVNRLAAARHDDRSLSADVRVAGRSALEQATMAIVILAIPFAVLGIACVNAASLLVARASLRSHEWAVRLALGAARTRLVRQILVESLLLSVAATLAAWPLARTALAWVFDSLDGAFALDARLLVAALLVALGTAAGFGLAPALSVSAARPARALATRGGDVTRTHVRRRAALVAVQVALSIALVAVGSQVGSSFAQANATREVDATHILMATIDLRQVNVAGDEARHFYERVIDRLVAVEGVEAAGAGTPSAFWRFNESGRTVMTWRPDAAPNQGRWAGSSPIVGDLFRVAGARLTQGRAFTRDEQSAPHPRVAIVNQAFADTVFGGAALGRTVRVATTRDYAAGTDVAIVGVIAPTWTNEFGGMTATGAIYLPAPLEPEAALTVYLRSSRPRMATSQLREVVRQVDPRVPLVDAATLAERTARAYPETSLAVAARALGVVAFALAAFGLAALISYLVTLRSRDIAVRLALGARPGRIVRLVVVQALRLAALGGIVGILSAILIGQVVRAEFHQAYGIDVVSTGESLALLIGAALVASALPALRASRLNPLTLLKDQ